LNLQFINRPQPLAQSFNSLQIQFWLCHPMLSHDVYPNTKYATNAATPTKMLSA
jgi:hypothetical protein